MELPPEVRVKIGVFIGFLFLLLVGIVAASLAKCSAEKYLEISWTGSLSFLFNAMPPEHPIARMWHQGIWGKVYGPGYHFIFLIHLFGETSEHDLTVIPENHYGLLSAQDGEKPALGQIVSDTDALSITCITYEDIVDGEKFLAKGGERGYQLLTLPPGKHVLNQKLFKVDPKKAFVVPSGRVAVQISSVGPEPDLKTEVKQVGRDKKGQTIFVLKPFAEIGHHRGVRPDVLYPGTHLINEKAFQLELVDTTPDRITLDGTTPTRFGTFEQPDLVTFQAVTATTKDGFTLPILAEAVIEVMPESAPIIVAVGGSLKGFVTDVVIPYIDDIVKTRLSNIQLIDLIEKRGEERDRIETALRVALEGRSAAEAALTEEQQNNPRFKDALNDGDVVDPHEHYPMELRTFRIMEIDYEKLGGAVKDFVATITRKRIAEQELHAIEAERIAAQARILVAQAIAEAEGAEIPIHARLQAEAAEKHAEAAEKILTVLGAQLKGMPEGELSKTTALALGTPYLGQILMALADKYRPHDKGQAVVLKPSEDRPQRSGQKGERRDKNKKRPRQDGGGGQNPPPTPAAS